MEQVLNDRLSSALIATHLPDLPRKQEAARLDDIVDIAQRVLWNPSKVSHADVEKLASAVIAHVERARPARFDNRHS